jgi:mono/diheme cytochrome c family protein
VKALAFAALLAAAAPALVAYAQEPAPASAPAPPTEPAPDAKAILEGVCTSCHGADFIAEHRKSRDDWDFTVRRMIDKGADLDPDTAQLLVDYLAKTYPPAEKSSPPA